MATCNFWKLAVVVGAALFSLPALAQAQLGGQRGGGSFRMAGDSPNDPSPLLTSESVQKELTLTDEQMAKLDALRDEISAGDQAFFMQFMGLPQAEMQKRLDERAKQTRQKLTAILTPKQMQRLNEINIQLAGIVALRFDDVAEKLALTAEQKDKLKTLGEEANAKMTNLFAANNGQPMDNQQKQEQKKKLDEISAERKEKSMALLTDEQKTKFEKVQGDKFDISTIKSKGKMVSGRLQMKGAPPVVPAK